MIGSWQQLSFMTRQMLAGRRAYDHSIAREAASLILRFPAMQSSELDKDFYLVHLCPGLRMSPFPPSPGLCHLRTVSCPCSAARSVGPRPRPAEDVRAWLQEYADALLTVNLAAMTKTMHNAHELGDKLSLAYDKSLSKRRGF